MLILSPSQSESQWVLSRDTPIHFIGIGGIGMSGLAKILLEAGFKVSGSDLKPNANTEALVKQGADIAMGHRAENLPDPCVIIVSTAIDSANPEIQTAQHKGFPIFHRSVLLKEILEGPVLGSKNTVGVTGTHGKTTISGMTSLVLSQAGLSPTIVVGGKIPHLNTNAVWGQNRHVAVAELDESDGTIVQYHPTLSVISNLELDHADHYTHGLEEILNTFRLFLSQLQPGSQVVFNMDCPRVRLLAESIPSHLIPVYLFPKENSQSVGSGALSYCLKQVEPDAEGCYQGSVYRDGQLLGILRLKVPGYHNLVNALCAVALGDRLEVGFDSMAQTLREFTGMGRRFEPLGHFQGAQLVDDYAHHPTEVEVTLKAARGALKGTNGRLIVVFQPHRYTRLKALWDEFKTCFKEADRLYLADVYAASEQPIPGISSKEFCEVVAHPQAEALTGRSWPQIREVLQKEIQPGDLVLSMGAGDITQLLRGWQP